MRFCIMSSSNKDNKEEEYQLVQVPVGGQITLEGNLSTPKNAQGIVIFAHGSGSSRHSPRNKYVAQVLQNEGIATLLIDLLTADEEEIDMRTRNLRFDIKQLAERLIGATDWWLRKEGGEEENNRNKNTDTTETQKSSFAIGYFGASTGAAAALIAAAESPNAVKAVVSRGGRPDLAGIDTLQRVQAPTLLIVGGNDVPVIDMNQRALDKMQAVKDNKKKLVIVPGATHLFEEPGKLEEVARLAADWFGKYLRERT